MKSRFAGFAFLLLAACSAKSQTVAPKSSPAQASAAAGAKIDPVKEADIRRLLELTGTKALVEQTMAEMTKSLKPTVMNSLPPGAYREKLTDLFFAKFMAKADAQAMLDLAVPSYDRNFTHEEIRGLIQFYQTPLGKKSVSVMPQLLAELQDQGRKWGENLGRQSMNEVISEHPEFEKQIVEAQRAAQAQR